MTAPVTTNEGVINAIHPRESSHWYDADGKPAYTIIGKNGKERNTTLRDAKQLGLRPSVTTISREAAKPQLENWKAHQVLLAALTLPRLSDEPEQEWVERIMADSKAQAKAAADRGTQIHTWIQQQLEGKLPENEDAMLHYLAVSAELDAHQCDARWSVEQSFCRDGYGGKVDLHQPGIVLDIKTKETPEKFALYDEHAMQLAAYRQGLNMPAARCGIVFVSTTGTPEAKLMWIDDDKLQRGWAMFCALLDYWYAKTGLSREKAH